MFNELINANTCLFVKKDHRERPSHLAFLTSIQQQQQQRAQYTNFLGLETSTISIFYVFQQQK